MNKNYFEDLCNQVLENEKLHNFESSRPAPNTLSLKNKNQLYEIRYAPNNKNISLVAVSEESSTVVSTWLFDEENISKKDIGLIAEDFAESMTPQLTKRTKTIKKKSSNDESNVTGLFFANRMVNIFPEIKKDIYIEKECYEEFRAVKFSREILLPKINDMLSNKKSDNSTIKKLGKLLSDLYSSGTLDVRSIITMVILNHLECPDALKPFITPELQTAWDAAKKYKDKKVKPEKPRKKNSFISKALEYQREEMKNQK